MAQFSLSPAVTVREINLTGYVPNIPSAKTGLVLRADKGPCLDITAVTNENDLVTKFGKPTAQNYQDWFQAWNFLQYASSLYIVRPMNTSTKNAGVALSDSVTSKQYSNFYNSRVAEYSLETFPDASESLYFINKDVTSDQRYAIAVCSSPQYFKSPIALEYTANVTNAIGTYSVTADGQTSLVKGSQVVLNGNKLVVVQSVAQNTSSSVITFDSNVASADVNPFYGVASSTHSVVNGQTVANFKKAGFTYRVGSKFKNSSVYITNIANYDDSNYIVTFSGSTTVSNGTTYSDSSMAYSATTAYNNLTNDYGIQAGQNTFKVNAGAIIEPGVRINIVNNGVSGIDGGTIVSSYDATTNNVTVVTPFTNNVTASSTITLSIVSSTTVKKIINGINYFDKIYDSGLIKKTRMTVTDGQGSSVNIVAQSLVPFNKIFDYPPNYVNNEFCLAILRKNDSGFYENFEKFVVSYNSNAKDASGRNIYAEEVLKNNSTAVYCKVGASGTSLVDTATMPLAKIISDVANGTTIYPNRTDYGKYIYSGEYTQGDIINAFSLFADPEMFDINIILSNELDENYASTIAETRKDCVAIVTPYNYGYLSQHTNTDCTGYLLDNYGSQTVNDGKAFSAFGTYSAVYGNMKYQYDKFNNVNRWVNIAGDVAGIYAQTDNTNDPWWAPAGSTRGIIKNAIKLAFNPNKQNRDDLYVNNINPIMSIPGEGNAIVWGQKTATATPSAFDRVNVRRLLIFLEKSISTAANIGLFEFNDTFTRTRLFNIIDPFLRSVQNRRGLYAYKLVIDQTNNTSQVIDANGLVIDIYLQPTKVAEFIRVNAIVTPTGANFAEYTGFF